MMQHDLFARARNTDPWTSHEAAASMSSKKIGKQHKAVLSVLSASSTPLAAEQIEDVLGYPIWRRMNELEKRGYIKDSGEVHINRSGRQARKFEVIA